VNESTIRCPFRSRATLAILMLALLTLPIQALAYAEPPPPLLDLTATWYGITALLVFVIAYSLVIGEEFLHLRKSKPVIVGAGIIWILIGIAYTGQGENQAVHDAAKHMLLEFAELMLFLLAAMTFVNTMEERGIFNALRAKLISAGFSLRSIFWLTGLLAFCISPVADNLTTALVMAAVVTAIGRDNRAFIVVACINIVVAANAGGAFSPFGDITTLMVWQAGRVHFSEFFALLIPSLANWLVPAFLMSFTVPKEKPEPVAETASTQVKYGGYMVVALFLGTIALAVVMHSYLHLPPAMGMMTGMGLLALFGYRLRRHELNRIESMTPAMENLRLDAQAREELLRYYKRGVGHPDVLLRRGAGRGRTRYHRLPGDGVRVDVYRPRRQCCQRPGRHPVRYRGQHPGDVCDPHHEPRDVPRAVAAGDAHRRRRRFVALHRLGGRGGTDGPGAGRIYLLRPSEMVVGHRAGLRRKHLDPLSDQQGAVPDLPLRSAIGLHS